MEPVAENGLQPVSVELPEEQTEGEVEKSTDDYPLDPSDQGQDEEDGEGEVLSLGEIEMDLNNPTVIIDGLKLKRKGQQTPFQSFAYALFPTTKKSSPVHWQYLSMEATEGENIRCHQLQAGDQLVELLKELGESLTKALLLINTEDSYSLPREYILGVKELPFPVLIVSNSDGEEIVRCLERFEDHVFARIDAENLVDGGEQPEAKALSSMKANDPPSLTNFQKLKKAAFGRQSKSITDLKTEIKRLMFDKTTPHVVSSDVAKFTMLMSAFHNYEKVTKRDNNHNEFNDIFKRLKAHMTSVFKSDFPFYIILCYRMHKKTHKYKCDEMGNFMKNCIYTMEDQAQISTSSLAGVLHAFIQRGDFDVRYNPDGDDDRNSSVFHLMKQACLELAEISYKVQNSEYANASPLFNGQRPLYKNFVYSRIMWISMAMKFHDAHKAPTTRLVKEVWSKLFVINRHRFIFTKPTIDELEKGLKLTCDLKLPQRLTFNHYHMGDLMAVDSDKTFRPFAHIVECLKRLIKFIPEPDDFKALIANLRSSYDLFLRQDGQQKLKYVSIDGTLTGCLNEGIKFLDVILTIFTKQKIRLDYLESEIRSWFELLLQLVDITGDNPTVHFKIFLSGKQTVTKKYKHVIQKYVIQATEKQFPKLSINQFFQLYKPFRFWSNTFLQNFLTAYKIPAEVKLSDTTWKQFFEEVISRFSTARLHYYLSDFLRAVGSKYRESKRPVDFVIDLLKIRVDKLLSAENEDDKESIEVRMKFSNYLYDYISRNALKHSLLAKMTTILASISDERDEFQLLVLDVLRRGVVPELKTVQGKELDENFKTLLKESVRLLRKDLSWLTSLSVKQRFCWGIIATCCSKMTISTDNFDWTHNYSIIIRDLGLCHIFLAYCNGKKLAGDKRIVSSKLPDNIRCHPSEDLRRYFEWIGEIQQVFRYWNRKFYLQEISYDEVLLYANSHIRLNPLGEEVCVSSLFIEFSHIQNIKTSFLTEFEMLNALFLRYIPGHPDAKWCVLTVLLEEYGISIPQKLQNLIMKNVSFPGKEGPISEPQLGTPLHPSTSGLFQPGCDVSLRLHRSTTLKELSEVVMNLDEFQHPLTEHLGMLVFFKLTHSVLFDRYLRYFLNKITATQYIPQGATPFKDFGFVVPDNSPINLYTPSSPPSGVSMENLVQSLKNTHDLFNRILAGIATYSEIIAEDELILQQLDIESEFSILEKYVQISNVSSDCCDGLKGVRSMLELFQYTSHIKNIHSVCQQYHLSRCIRDPLLRELTDIMQDHMVEEDRSKMTPLVASEKMRRVKEILCLGSHSSSKCLDVFAAMTDSADFYQFMRDKQFYGQQGQAIFLQQYELITAQLQHEEYDESVLNHLLAAFKVISPFMDVQKKFTDLMKEVTALNAVNGLKQLETVNKNITLIRLWFSRAEGDTLQNVAKELECIIATGNYTFQLGGKETGNGRGQMLLEYEPSSAQLSVKESPKTRGSGERSLEGPGNHIMSQRSLENQLSVEGSGVRIERWNSEQIGDFVRKLGFMDKEKEGGDRIKHFLHLTQTAYKLFELYQKLRELGHPQYLSEGTTAPLSCSKSKDEVDQLVYQTQLHVTEWTHQVSELQTSYKWLLYFSVPKLLQLYWLISSHSLNTDPIVHEVSFLAANHSADREKLRAGVKRALRKVESGDSPMLVVGQFLDVLFKGHTLHRRCSLKDTQSLLHHRSLISYTSQPLHSCPTYSQADFLCLIINIFSGIPESYQVMRCRATTTEEELSLFLKRAGQNPSHYLVLGVNHLSFKLQECMVQLHMAMQRDQSQPDLSLQLPPSTIHFVETTPSMLREMPWIQLKEYKDCKLSLDEAKRICMSYVMQSKDFACIQLVYGSAGDGKTHYIKKQLANCSEHVTIALNEAFSPLNAILKLRSLSLFKKNVGLFFNFTILPPGDSVVEAERIRYHELMDVIGWFFFDLLVIGYVEDPDTGLSFRLPGELEWAVYIEVPSRDKNVTAGEALKLFHRDVPSLKLLGTPHYIHPDIPYTVDEDAQLVCKYLRAFKTKTKDGSWAIDRLFREGHNIVKFSKDPVLSEEECHKLLYQCMPKHIASTKITQRLFIRYMKRRCEFLDCLPAFNYNNGAGVYKTNELGMKYTTNTKQLGSTLMNTMLKEVSDFCDPSIKENWSLKAHQQLVYDFREYEAGSFGLISLHPDQLKEAEKMKFRKIGVTIPSMTDLYSREWLDGYLSQALNLKLENGRLSVIDDSEYVLTLDYTIKMLNIHERHECAVPVIIEGETGVGKTALVEMLSKLWNQSLLLEWKKQKGRLLDFFLKKLGDIDTISENYQACVQAVEAINSGEVTEDALLTLCNHLDDTHSKFYSQLQKYLRPMRDNPVLPLLTFKKSAHSHFDELFKDADAMDSPEATSHLLYAILMAQVIPTFHKINVHAAMTPADIWLLFKPVFDQARLLELACHQKLERLKTEEESKVKRKESIASRHSSGLSSLSSGLNSVSSGLNSVSSGDSEESCTPPTLLHRTPFVTVFLDEVNTSSCLGLFKEVIVDRSFDGEPIPNNVFIVAACNPHRGNSLASHDETWIRGSYYVRSLHPTLKFLMWDYGSLDEHQERDYINAKMKMVNRNMANPEVASLTTLIVASQKMMRDFAFRQLKENLKSKSTQYLDLAHISSKSSVSQRDIQRVFTFYQWFKTMYDKYKPHGNCHDYHRRSVLVALGIVYYMRLNAKYRNEYRKFLDKEHRLPNEISFSQAFDEELNFYIKQVELPKGIARTLALKENLFATIVCTVTHTPLIIVGAPGSSKTLSFNQTIANLKGQESKKSLFRNTEIFRSLDPHYYQCSRRTTSNEIQTVFSRAVNRQRSHQKFNLPIYCVVFMDEAGLPEESHESLKVLHYHLDKQEVSFVAITNHVLDAAKTNRAISLYRPDASDEDLETLAKGCLCSNPVNPPAELRRDLDMVAKFCRPYSECMRSSRFSRFFGLRDFIQFVNYLRRKRDEGSSLSSHLVLQALERNFNGSEEFESICKKFLQVIGTRLEDVMEKRRMIVEVLQESMQDRPQPMQDLTENEVRYKLIIDPSEDDSLVRLLFSMGVLERVNTRMFVCSDFPGDGQVQKINTIAAIRHSAIEGHTAVMSQTDDIHESFYDLFNQRFRRIDDPEHGPRYYTNIAIGAHLKPSRVHPSFQCVVVVKKSEIVDTPAPFLNRFEKYLISHGSLLETALLKLPPCLSILIKTAKEKVNDFINSVFGYKSLYGLQPETLDSLILDFLPPLGHTYQALGEDSLVDDSQEVEVYLMQEVINALRNNGGFNCPRYPLHELRMDTQHVFSLIVCDPEFEGLLKTLTHQEAMNAVVEAINLLYTAPGPQEEGGQLDLTPEGCMVVSFLQQVLIRLLTKRLMQLMTTEAIILHRNKIPFSYLGNYLGNQAHFSLKEAVTNYHAALKATILDRSKSPNKLVFFTRSSPLIHSLPAQFPTSVIGIHQDFESTTKTVSDLVFEETEKVMVHKLSTLHSQSSVQEMLRDFVESKAAEVCLLLANMQETTCKTINHIRVMIEEGELKLQQQCKVFVLLLHFPPAQFFQHCYPALFLKGWDQCYLDTIAHSAVRGVVDIREWFFSCCFPSQVLESGQDKSDPLLQSLNQLLPQIISVLSARLHFGKKSDGSFNSNMNATQRSHALRRLLFECEVGGVLCEKFCFYWKPKVMAEYLERAATFSKQRESTLNITDSIQTQFKSLFIDFCVYMLTRANESLNLDIVFAPDCSPSLRKLFIDIFRIFPVPKLNQLNLLSNNLPSLQPPTHCPHFPFFNYVCSLMEKHIEVSWETANLQVDVLADQMPDSPLDSLSVSPTRIDPGVKLQALVKAVLTNIEPMLNVSPKQVLAIVISSMTSDPDIWHCYFDDFIVHKLKLGGQSPTLAPRDDVGQMILRTYFEQIHGYDAPRRIVELHCYVNIYQLRLAQMATILRPLSNIQTLQGPHLLSPSVTPTSPAKELLLAMRETQWPLRSIAYLANFVITTLFHGLLSSTYQSSSVDTNKLHLWFKSYRDIMTLPTLKDYIYYSLYIPAPSDGSGQPDGSGHLEARLNVMHTIYLTLLSSPTMSKDVLLRGQQVFQTLFTRFFKENLELKSEDVRPGLAAVLEVAVEVSLASGSITSLHYNNPAVKTILEGLLAHFFSAGRPSYHREDILWFLKFANEQEQWRVSPFLEDSNQLLVEMSTGIVSGKLEEDLVSKLETTHTEIPSGALEVNTFKFYLAHILGNYEEHSDQKESSPLLLYRPDIRTLIGEVLMLQKDLGNPEPYIPNFYQLCPPIQPGKSAKNLRMQQPLSHLYFLTVMEHLLSRHHLKSSSKLDSLVRIGSSVYNQLETAQGGEAILLWVEFQAVIQVLIQQLAMHLDPSKPHRLGDAHLVLDDINNILDNTSMGGEASLGHGMVLALHLIKLLKSTRRFTDLITNKYDSIRKINSLHSLHQRLLMPSEMLPHKLPFLQLGAEGGLTTLYKQVSSVMEDIHEGKQELGNLVQIAHNYVGSGEDVRKRHCLRMVIWLATYYQFYDKKRDSGLLCNIMGGHEMAGYLQEEGYIRLIQCFLNPKLMIQRKEAPNALTEQQVLELGPDGRPQVIQRQGTQVDPIYQLFSHQHSEELDQSDVDLRHSIANLIAVVLGSPSRSNHLWYHLFAADKLQNTYMTGFMYNATIHPDGLLYDCGVELSPEGQFGRQDYKKHACRGTYTLHSLYLLLWANFGAFCVALLTQPDADARIHGPIISEWLSVRHYCISQLRTVWLHIRNNLGLSEEQRSFFVMRAMNRFHQILMSRHDEGMMEGVFKNQEELDEYERMWHTSVYQPTWNELPEKFLELSNQQQNKLFNEIRQLEAHYPHFPSEQEFAHCVLSAGDLKQHSEGGKLWFLARFAMEWPRLQLGGLLVPDLIELYQWLHMNIAHLITYDQAASITIGRVIQLAERNSSKEMKEHLRNLYESVKINYNHYVELIGGAIGAGACAAVRQGNKIFTIADDIPILHFLSDVEEENQGNDWLYVVISDILTNHNTTIENLYSIIQTNKHTPLARLLPEEPSKIAPTEVNINNCAIVSRFTELHGINSFLQLIRKHYLSHAINQAATASFMLASRSWGSLHLRQHGSAFQWEELEETLVSAFISGKPLVEHPSLLRIPFKFKEGKKEEDGLSPDIEYAALDLKDMAERLPVEFRVHLHEALLKRFEYEFHSASYHLMMEVVTGLRTVAGHLMKILEEETDEYGDLAKETVPEFMLHLYEHLKKHSDVLYEIGIQTASPSHLSCLADLPLTATYSCLRLFFKWVEEGVYDFSDIPFPFKVHMSYQDQMFMDQQLRLRWTGTVNDLNRELEQLVDVLKHSERNITSMINEATNKPILDYLIEYHMLEEKEDLITCFIPRTIMLHHYVAFRLSLRRLLLKVQQELEDAADGQRDVDIWSEFISNLWEKHLPHLREVLYGEGLFVFDPKTGYYGFQQEDDNEEEDRSSGDELVAALLRDATSEEEEESGSFKMQDHSTEESFAVISEDVIGHTYDLNQHSSEEEEESDGEEERNDGEALSFADDLETRLKNDPELKQKVMSLVKSIGQDTSQEVLARRFSPEDVADFLTKVVGLPQYADTFKNSGISGDVLLGADAEMLIELEVKSPLHQMKIMELFRRELQGTEAKYSKDHVSVFLKQYKLDKYVPMLESHGIDGDMILEVEEKLMKSVLKEIGVTSLVDVGKIRAKYITYVTENQ